MTRQTRTALLAAAAVLGWSITAFAQLDPLTLIKRVPPTVIIVVDTSLEMLQDGNGKFYDPGFYSRTADPIGVDSLERAGSGRDLPPDLRGVHIQRDRQIPDHEDHASGGHVGSVEPGDGELAERLRRVLRAHPVSDCERRHRAGRRGKQQRHRAVGSLRLRQKSPAWRSTPGASGPSLGSNDCDKPVADHLRPAVAQPATPRPATPAVWASTRPTRPK